MPAPFCGQFCFERARQHGAEYWKPALVEEVSAEFDVSEVFEEFACFAARLDACQGVAGAVSVSAQKLAGARVCLPLACVLLEIRFGFAGDEMDQFDA